MRNLEIGEIVEIWEPIDGARNGLETHLVQCTANIEKNSKTFRGINFPTGPLNAFELRKINKIFPWGHKAHMEFLAKTKKGGRNVY